MPNKRKKRGKKSKRSGEERKQKVKGEGGSETFLEKEKKNDLEILLSAHAQILKAVIWHQE